MLPIVKSLNQHSCSVCIEVETMTTQPRQCTVFIDSKHALIAKSCDMLSLTNGPMQLTAKIIR